MVSRISRNAQQRKNNDASIHSMRKASDPEPERYVNSGLRRLSRDPSKIRPGRGQADILQRTPRHEHILPTVLSKGVQVVRLIAILGADQHAVGHEDSRRSLRYIAVAAPIPP